MKRGWRIITMTSFLTAGVALIAWGESMYQAALAGARRVAQGCGFSCPVSFEVSPLFREAEVLGILLVIAAIIVGALMLRTARRNRAAPA